MAAQNPSTKETLKIIEKKIRKRKRRKVELIYSDNK